MHSTLPWGLFQRGYSHVAPQPSTDGCPNKGLMHPVACAGQSFIAAEFIETYLCLLSLKTSQQRFPTKELLSGTTFQSARVNSSNLENVISGRHH